MNKLYSVHDHWTDINKKNDVDIESIDGVIAGIKVNGEDYGGSITWESVYSGSIDPDGEVSPFTADISLTMTASDKIKVIYDNTEYVLPKQVFNDKIYYGAEPASLPADIDFSNCPFLIQVLPDTIRIYTETAGLHTFAISVPQSGGGESDLTWILPEQTVTLVDQPVEITGLRRDLIPTSVMSVALKVGREDLGHDVIHYYSLIYLNDAFNTDDGNISIFTADEKNMFVITDGEEIISNTYTISIALF